MNKEEARIYHQMSADFQLQDGLKLLDVLSPRYNDSVLDIGCGTGRLSMILSDKLRDGGKVIGVDPDSERIKIAANEGKGYANLQFMVGSDQTFPEDQYDMVLSTHVIHWIKDKRKTFKRVYNNLKPGGKFGFNTLVDGLPELMKEIAQLCGTQTDAVMNSMYFEDGDYYKQLAEEVGFNVLYLDTSAQECTLPSIDAFIDLSYGVLHGKFDRNDSNLVELKKRYSGQPISWTLHHLFVIITKPTAD